MEYAINSHIEGGNNNLCGSILRSHMECMDTTISGEISHSHLEGKILSAGTITWSHVEGVNNSIFGVNCCHVEGRGNRVDQVNNTHVEGQGNRVDQVDNTHVEGWNNVVSGGSWKDANHVGGSDNNVFYSKYSHVGGLQNIVSGGNATVVYGRGNQVSGDLNSVFGVGVKVSGQRNFVWNNNYSWNMPAASVDVTYDIGDRNGSFSVNPDGGINGFFIGNKSLYDCISTVVGQMPISRTTSSGALSAGKDNTVNNSVSSNILGYKLVVQNSNAATVEGWAVSAFGAKLGCHVEGYLNLLSAGDGGNHVEGRENRVINSKYSHVGGLQNDVTNSGQAIVYGRGNQVSGDLNSVFGVGVKVSGQRNFVWNNKYAWDSSTSRAAITYDIGNKNGSFCVNPENGLSSFYIGQQNFIDCVASAVERMTDNQKLRVKNALGL